VKPRFLDLSAECRRKAEQELQAFGPAVLRDTLVGSDHGLGNVEDPLVPVTNLEHSTLAQPVAAGLRTLLDVTAGTECLLDRAGQNHRLNLPIGPRHTERPVHPLDGFGAKDIVTLVPIDWRHCR